MGLGRRAATGQSDPHSPPCPVWVTAVAICCSNPALAVRIPREPGTATYTAVVAGTALTAAMAAARFAAEERENRFAEEFQSAAEEEKNAGEE